MITSVLPSTWECPGHEIRGSKQNLKAPHKCCLNVVIKSREDPDFRLFNPSSATSRSISQNLLCTTLWGCGWGRKERLELRNLDNFLN